MIDFSRLDYAAVQFILEGVFVTLKFTSISVFGGIVLGTILCFLRLSHIKPLEIISAFYVSVFRGIPLILQLVMMYFGLAAMGYPFKPFTAGVLVFSLNSGAYIAEILRAGIVAVDKGQVEAAVSLGVSYPRRMIDIIIPQAIKNILPSLLNEMVDLLKESALVSIIGEADLMRRAQQVAAARFTYFEPFIIAGACYYVLVMMISYGVGYLEKRMKTND